MSALSTSQASLLEKDPQTQHRLVASQQDGGTWSHLDELEAESIHIIREVAAQCARPVMLYSIGKDSSVLVRLAQKAFYPAPLPFPLLHIDTSWKFKEMIAFRDQFCAEAKLTLKVHQNLQAIQDGITPFTHGSAAYTQALKTQALLAALQEGGFDAAFGGARRDEEASRAKERVFSFRDAFSQWDPKNQRPELWSLYNGHLKPGESIRAFPLSHWTEMDVWRYIQREKIPIVPLYLATMRPVVERDGALIMVDDARFPLQPSEQPKLEMVRFRTLGCYPLTAAMRSSATTLDAVIAEVAATQASERQGRLIDFDQAGSMEQKKREGYF